MNLRLLAAVFGGVLLTASACASGSSSSSSNSSGGQAGTLTVAVGNDIDTLDPQAQATASVMAIEDMMVEELTRLDQTGAAQPLLATKWEQSADGRTWTFTLREGVKFTDGTPFNAQAVKFSLDRLNSKETFKGAPNQLVIISSVEAVDATHVKINLKSAFPALPLTLTLPIAGIISPASATVSPNTQAKISKPVGTGPYVFGSYSPGERLVLNANADYWGTKPTYKTQVYTFVPDSASRYTQFQAGQADVVVGPPASNLGGLQQAGTLKYVNNSYVIQIQFNTADIQQPLMKNKTVRQALSYAVDRNALIKSVLFGAGKPLTGIIPATDPGYCATGNYDYNPDKAKQMLASAGASGMSLRLSSPQGRYPQDYQVAQAVAGYFRAVGVNVTLANPSDFSTYLAGVVVTPDKANNDAHLLGWGALYGDASQALLEFRGDQVPPKGYNSTYYSNPAYDSLVAKGDADPNPASHNASYCDAQKLVFEDAPVIWLYQELDPIAVSSKVTGVTSTPTGMLITTNAKPKS